MNQALSHALLTPMCSYSQLDISNNCLCGIWHEHRIQKGTYTAEGITALADALRVNASLTALDVHLNQLGGGGEKVLEQAVKGRRGFDLKV